MASLSLPETSAGRLRILLLEDAAPDAELELRDLRRASIEFEARVVQDEAAFRREIEAMLAA